MSLKTYKLHWASNNSTSKYYSQDMTGTIQAHSALEAIEQYYVENPPHIGNTFNNGKDKWVTQLTSYGDGIIEGPFVVTEVEPEPKPVRKIELLEG